MITIEMKNGAFYVWHSEEYTDYDYLGTIFVVKNNEQWIGIYSADCIEAIEVKK